MGGGNPESRGNGWRIRAGRGSLRIMMGDPRGQWEMDKAAAAALLADRGRRRRALGACALGLLGMLAVGLWGIDEWLARSVMRFAVYWGGCGLWCLFVMLFALFDALAVIRELRDGQGGD